MRETETNVPAGMQPVRPLYWSVRRELWENRSVYLAPLIVAGVALFAVVISMARLPKTVRGLASDPVRQQAAISHPFGFAVSAVMLTGFIVGAFYAIDALNGERRDRSILFWKSMPVSDRTTVLSKAGIPIVFVPLLSFALSLAMHWIMLLLSSAVLVVNGLSPAPVWTARLLQSPFVMLYGLTVHALWFAPIYCWLLLVSAWARRGVLLWAVLPSILAGIVSRIVFGVDYAGAAVRYRLTGAMAEAFSVDPMKSAINRFDQLDPLKFLTSSGLWIGLILAAAFLAAAVRLRRRREPS